MMISNDRNTVTLDDGAECVFVEGDGEYCYPCALDCEGSDEPCDLWCQGVFRDDGKDGNFQLKEVVA